MCVWHQWIPASRVCPAPVPAGVTAWPLRRWLPVTWISSTLFSVKVGKQETSQHSGWFVRCGLWPDPEGTKKL